jgi:hypothetical protein
MQVVAGRCPCMYAPDLPLPPLSCGLSGVEPPRTTRLKYRCSPKWLAPHGRSPLTPSSCPCLPPLPYTFQSQRRSHQVVEASPTRLPNSTHAPAAPVRRHAWHAAPPPPLSSPPRRSAPQSSSLRIQLRSPVGRGLIPHLRYRRQASSPRPVCEGVSMSMGCGRRTKRRSAVKRIWMPLARFVVRGF